MLIMIVMKIKEIIKRTRLFSMYCEHRIWKDEKRRFIEESNALNLSYKEHNNYTKTLNKYRISPSEFFYQYKFYGLSETQRKEYLMRSEMQKVYRKLVDPQIRAIFYNKVLFLSTYSDIIKRKWLVANSETNKSELINLLTSVDTIIKPIEGSLGKGIYKLNYTAITDPEGLADKLMRDCVLVEECIKATDSIQEFHPNSLNTIRVVTFSNEQRSEVIGAFIRFGCHGSVVDNAHAGGIFATIDVESGQIISDGLDTNGEEYICHPDSQKNIKGFTIPYWNLIKDTCIRATRMVPGLKFAGWDCVVLPNGKVDIIEGNHAPDVDVMQSPLKIGIRQKIAEKLKLYFNYNLH